MNYLELDHKDVLMLAVGNCCGVDWMNFVFEKREISQWRRFLMPLVEMDADLCF